MEAYGKIYIYSFVTIRLIGLKTYGKDLINMDIKGRNMIRPLEVKIRPLPLEYASNILLIDFQIKNKCAPIYIPKIQV